MDWAFIGHWEVSQKINASIEIIDLRSLAPLDYETICKSVIKTHRALILHEDTLVGGIGGELAAYLGEHLFKHLDAPVMRVGSLDTPFPFAKPLEDQYLANRELQEKLASLLSY